MRCQSCNKLLNDYEATRRHAITNQFLDLCSKCLADVPAEIPVIVREDLSTIEEIDDEEPIVGDWGDDEGGE